MEVYENIPENFLEEVVSDSALGFPSSSYCAGFELKAWRCNELADHFIEWLADYALKEDELAVSHGNMYVRLREAAARVYKSENYKKRGEIGEIALHAICREFFDTIPITPRVFYLTSSNEVVKSFDSVHVRYPDSFPEIWLGEAKFYEDRNAGLKDAIASVRKHIDQGFLKNEKLILGPQISKNIPHYEKIRSLFSSNTSLDKLFQSAVFPICITSNSDVTGSAEVIDPPYRDAIKLELEALSQSLAKSGLGSSIRLALFYVPLGCKKSLAKAFDDRLKGLNP
ncbi:DUF1837 domain-containing protein [Qipengyuania sp. RANM35]|uniref:HamA C-terminal domain-containing protein n=1 Tax=Qipengyuania sp. RANM35 TaxID=3068635 RepID=UPI0034DB6DC9